MLALLLLASLALAGTLQVDILDIGQGDAILLRSPDGKVMLIDGGTGKRPVPPMLAARGVERIDLMIATHPHADHIGGLDDVIEAMPVGVYIDSKQTHTTATYSKLMGLIEQKQDIRYVPSKPGQILNLGAEVTVELLHPQITMLTGTRSDLNSNSVVARVTHGDNCFLFTGDAEDPTERTLMQKGIEPCGVLKVAHHGGAHSTSDAWLDKVEPTIALISAGEGNRYGHPTEETLSRLERAGATVYRTDTMGAIHLESDGQTVTVSTEREPGTPRPDLVRADPPSNHTASTHSHDPTPPPVAVAGERIDINSAGTGALESLPGIGPSKASAIIEYRNANGPFTDISQLDNVPGIGPATMDKLRPLVSVGATAEAGAGSSTAASVGAGMNINTASQSELESLPGIGPSKASAIIEFRNANGPFSDVSQLDNVPGIGAATVSSLRPLVSAGDSEATPPPPPPPNEAAVVPPTDAPQEAETAEKVNVNTASSAELTRLPGINGRKAKKIVAFRENYGPFASCDGLSRVKSINDKTVTAARPMCTTR